MEIRYATAEDHAGFIALEAEIQTQHHLGAPYKFPPTGVISRDDFLALLQETDERVLVAVEDGEIVGYLQCQLLDHPASYYTYPEKLLYVAVLKVRDSHHRRGIGDALLERATEIAHAFGASRITLEVYTFNEGAARFYERVGFAPLKYVMSKTIAEDQA